MTSEQAIILGLLSAAFVAGWIVHAATGYVHGPPGRRDWAARVDASLAAAVPPVPNGIAVAAAPSPNGIAVALGASRDALDRAVTDYHTAVALLLRDGDASTTSDAMFELFGRDVERLASAVEGASDELADDPLGDELRASGSALRRLADDVLLCSREAKSPPPEILDRSEERLISAATAISVCAAS